jgi:hypothetical protein
MRALGADRSSDLGRGGHVGADSIDRCTFFTADGVDAAPAVLAQLARSGSVISMTAAVLPGDRALYPAITQRPSAIPGPILTRGR